MTKRNFETVRQEQIQLARDFDSLRSQKRQFSALKDELINFQTQANLWIQQLDILVSQPEEMLVLEDLRDRNERSARLLEEDLEQAEKELQQLERELEDKEDGLLKEQAQLALAEAEQKEEGSHDEKS